MSADLIARLEAASVGSLELSAEIERDVVGHMVHEWPFWFRATSFDGVENSAVVPGIPYTESVDAALTLAREGYIGLQRFSDGWYAQVARHSTGFRYEGTQKPAALALCIAALKARAGVGIVA